MCRPLRRLLRRHLPIRLRRWLRLRQLRRVLYRLGHRLFLLHHRVRRLLPLRLRPPLRRRVRFPPLRR